MIEEMRDQLEGTFLVAEAQQEGCNVIHSLHMRKYF